MTANEYKTKRSMLAMAAVVMMVAVAFCAMVPVSEATDPEYKITICYDEEADRSLILYVGKDVTNDGFDPVGESEKEWNITLSGVSRVDKVGTEGIEAELEGYKLTGFIAQAKLSNSADATHDGYNVKIVATGAANEVIKNSGVTMESGEKIYNDNGVWIYEGLSKEDSNATIDFPVYFSRDGTGTAVEFYVWQNQNWVLDYKLTVDDSDIKTEIALSDEADDQSGDDPETSAWVWDCTASCLTINNGIENQDALIIESDGDVTVNFNNYVASKESTIYVNSTADANYTVVMIGDTWIKGLSDRMVLEGTIILEQGSTLTIDKNIMLGKVENSNSIVFQNKKTNATSSVDFSGVVMNDTCVIESTEKGLYVNGSFTSSESIGTICVQNDAYISGEVIYAELVSIANTMIVIPEGKELKFDGMEDKSTIINNVIYMETWASVVIGEFVDSTAMIMCDGGSVNIDGVAGTSEEDLRFTAFDYNSKKFIWITGAWSENDGYSFDVYEVAFFGTVKENDYEPLMDRLPYVPEQPAKASALVNFMAGSTIVGSIQSTVSGERLVSAQSQVTFPYFVIDGIWFENVVTGAGGNYLENVTNIWVSEDKISVNGGIYSTNTGFSGIYVPTEMVLSTWRESVDNYGTLFIGDNVHVYAEDDGGVTNNGEMHFCGIVENKLILNYGMIYIPYNTDIKKIATDGMGDTGAYSYFVPPKSTGLEDYIRGNVYFSENDVVYLVKDVTIGPNATLTIDGTLDLKGKKLIVEGTLVIGKNACVIGDVEYLVLNRVMEESKIVLRDSGEIINDGIIGKSSRVFVLDSREDGFAEVKEVSNINFSLTDIDGEMHLVVSGNEVSYKSDDNKLAIRDGAAIGNMTIRALKDFTIYNAYVLPDCTLTIGDRVGKATVKNLVLLQDSKLIVKSPINATESSSLEERIYLTDGSSVQIDADTNNTKIEASTQPFKTFDSEGQRVIPEIDDVNGPAYGTALRISGIVGCTVYVDTVTYDVDKVNYTEQRLNIRSTVYGDGIEVVGDSPAIYAASFYWKWDEDLERFDPTLMTVDQKENAQVFYIQTGDDFYVPEGAVFDNVWSGVETVLVVNGLALSVDEQANTKYIGTYYARSDGMHMISPFANAFAIIDDVKDKTLYMSGGYVFTEDLTLADDQVILDVYGRFAEGSFGSYSVAEGVLVKVEAGAELKLPFTVPSGIQGAVFVDNNAYCVPTTGSYEVKKVIDGEGIIYTSLKAAIQYAEEGESIDIVNDVVFSDDVTIPKGVTVNLLEGKTMTANGNLTVDGVLNVADSASVTVGKDLNVNGTVNLDGTVMMTSGAVNAKGVIVESVKYSIRFNDFEMNGVYFEKDGKFYFSNLANAVEMSSDVSNPTLIVNGTVVESEGVILSEGMTLKVGSYTGTELRPGNLTVPSVTLNKRAVFEVNSDYDNGRISGFSGSVKGYSGTTDGANTEVILNSTGDYGFKNTYSMETSSWKFEMFGMKYADSYMAGWIEEITFASGTVIIRDTFNGYYEEMLITDLYFYGKTVINAGATVEVPENVFIDFTSIRNMTTFETYDAYLIVNGTLNINGGNVNIGLFDAAYEGPNFEDHKNASADINGSVNVNGGYFGIVEGKLSINGVVDATDGRFHVYGGKTTVGTAAVYAGAGAAVIGNIAINTYVVAYANSDMSEIVPIVVTGEFGDYSVARSTFATTEYALSGVKYATVYAPFVNEIEIDEAIPSDDIRIPGKVAVTGWQNGNGVEVGDKFIGSEKNVNMDFDITTVIAKFSQGNGLTMYIDGLTVSNYFDFSSGEYRLEVGEHTVSFDVITGYNGDNVKVSVDGKTVTSGKFTVSVGASMVTVAINGAVPQAAPVAEEDSGLSITDILLIVIVILIIILGAFVAMRMMRS